MLLKTSIESFLRKWNYHIDLYQKKRNVAVAFVKKVFKKVELSH